jgi:hypothetical protein
MTRKGKPFIKLLKTTEGFPAVRASVETTQGVVSGCFYIDTGATTSFISDSLSEENGIKNTIISVGNHSSETSIVKIKYNIEGLDRIGYFHKIREDKLGTDVNGIILGILGTDFLINNGGTLDFSKGFLHFRSRASSNKKNHYSLKDGFVKYKLPLIIINSSNTEYVCLIDSASESNLITKSTTDKIDVVSSDMKTNITGPVGTISGSLIKEKFVIHGIFDKYMSTHILEDDFCLISDYSCLLETDDEELCITAVLGCHFLWQNHCIVDFRNGIFKI